MKSKLFFWTDIPTPYRVLLYNLLKKNKLNFEVWYTKSNVNSRPWRIHNLRIRHNFILGKSIYFYLKNNFYHFFFSPNLIFRAIKLDKINPDSIKLSMELIKRQSFDRNQLRLSVTDFSEENFSNQLREISKNCFI